MPGEGDQVCEVHAAVQVGVAVVDGLELARFRRDDSVAHLERKFV